MLISHNVSATASASATSSTYHQNERLLSEPASPPPIPRSTSLTSILP